MVEREYVLERHHKLLLLQAARAWDRCEQARLRIAKDGCYVANRFGELRAHPGVAVERDSRLAFARLVRELCLDIEPPGASENRRVPRINSRGPLKLSC